MFHYSVLHLRHPGVSSLLVVRLTLYCVCVSYLKLSNAYDAIMLCEMETV